MKIHREKVWNWWIKVCFLIFLLTSGSEILSSLSVSKKSIMVLSMLLSIPVCTYLNKGFLKSAYSILMEIRIDILTKNFFSWLEKSYSYDKNWIKILKELTCIRRGAPGNAIEINIVFHDVTFADSFLNNKTVFLTIMNIKDYQVYEVT